MYAKSFKDHPGGLFPARHEPIIDKYTWQMVQKEMKRPEEVRTSLNDAIPFRAVLKCQCGQPLTGAVSRGNLGNYFYYYTCKHSRHLNLSAVKAHDQFLAARDLMSLTTNESKRIKQKSGELMNLEINKNKEFLNEKKQELAKEQ